MAAAAMDAALASLRGAVESLLEEKLELALAEVEALRSETAQLKLEQQALARESVQLREETETLRGELKELRLRLGDEAASTAPPGSPLARAESPASASSTSEKDGRPGADGPPAVERLLVSLRKTWYVAAVERVLVLEADETQTEPNPIKLEEAEALEARAGKETEDLWAN